MILGIVSDIHENNHNLLLAFKQMEQLGVEEVLCLGDLMNTGVAKRLAKAPFPVHMVWGNNDGDKVKITKASFAEGSRLTTADDSFDFIVRDGQKIFMTHYPELAYPIAKSGDFDAVFFGHTHKKVLEHIGNCLLLNPGEVSAHKTTVASFAIYNTSTKKGEIHDIKGHISLKTELVQGY